MQIAIHGHVIGHRTYREHRRDKYRATIAEGPTLLIYFAFCDSALPFVRIVTILSLAAALLSPYLIKSAIGDIGGGTCPPERRRRSWERGKAAGDDAVSHGLHERADLDLS